MNTETKVAKEKFQNATGIKVKGFSANSGSMRPFWSIKLPMTEEVEAFISARNARKYSDPEVDFKGIAVEFTDNPFNGSVRVEVKRSVLANA